MPSKRERGLHEMYRADPFAADAALFGTPLSRRALLGAAVPFAALWPVGLMPALFAQTGESFALTGKDGLTVLNDKPLVAETPPHLLDDAVTPIARMFVRNNGLMPDLAAKQDATGWTLTIDGEVERPLTLSLADLKRDFKQHTKKIWIECAGNGRAGFFPPAAGNQWTYGGVGCPEWTGVLLRDVLAKAGVKKSAVYTGYYGLDRHISGDPAKFPISRGVPIAAATKGDALIAFAMNGQPLPPQHGFPARLVHPGFPASVSGKWLQRIAIRDKEHDGEKMTGHSYRMPRNPVTPGAKVPASDMVILESMPVKSLISFPRSGTTVPARVAKSVAVRGAAWAGSGRVARVDVSIDFGATWIKAKLDTASDLHAWQRWSAQLAFAKPGYHEVWARATDAKGIAQPMVIPGWNPEGYCNNASPRIAVTIV